MPSLAVAPPVADTPNVPCIRGKDVSARRGFYAHGATPNRQVGREHNAAPISSSRDASISPRIASPPKALDLRQVRVVEITIAHGDAAGHCCAAESSASMSLFGWRLPSNQG